jgi:preprotein translocase subunit SecF
LQGLLRNPLAAPDVLGAPGAAAFGAVLAISLGVASTLSFALPVAAILFIGAFLLGAGTLRDISLALFTGILVGTFSSVFIATPLLTWLKDLSPAVAAHNATVAAGRAALPEGGEGGSVRVGSLLPGTHLGVQAQPRKKRSGRAGGR